MHIMWRGAFLFMGFYVQHVIMVFIMGYFICFKRKLTLLLANRMVCVDLACNTNGKEFPVLLKLLPTQPVITHIIQNYTAVFKLLLIIAVFKKRSLILDEFI